MPAISPRIVVAAQRRQAGQVLQARNHAADDAVMILVGLVEDRRLVVGDDVAMTEGPLTPTIGPCRRDALAAIRRPVAADCPAGGYAFQPHNPIGDT